MSNHRQFNVALHVAPKLEPMQISLAMFSYWILKPAVSREMWEMGGSGTNQSWENGRHIACSKSAPLFRERKPAQCLLRITALHIGSKKSAFIFIFNFYSFREADSLDMKWVTLLVSCPRNPYSEKTNIPSIPSFSFEAYLYLKSSLQQSKNIARGTTGPEIDSMTCISCKFGHHMAPLVSVANLTTRWHHLQ